MSPSEFISEPQTSAEPQTGRMIVPVWLFIVLFLLLYWGATYFDQHGGWFDSRVYTPNPDLPIVFQPPPIGPDFMRNGQQKYEAICALCHNPDGAGKPLQAPPLAGSEWVLTEGVNRLIRIPRVGLTGPIEVKGQPWNLAMPPMGAALPDKDLADALSYIRNSWGNKASRVTVEQVKAVRAELGNRSQPYTGDEIKALPDAVK